MNKICFIACTNNSILMSECEKYICRLYVPDGYIVEIITIKDAVSMAEGYNRAMHASDAKYKIYLHQDLFIINRYFLINMIRIFESDGNISMIGMVGTQNLPSNAVMWNADRIGKLCPSINDDCYDELMEDISIYEVIAVDGAIIATSKDIGWREDLFRGFDFYDVSESLEHRRKGYKVVVPHQNNTWCVHHDGSIINLLYYDDYRNIFIDNYQIDEFSLNDELRYSFNYSFSKDNLKQYENQLKDISDNRDRIIDNLEYIYDFLDSKIANNDIDGFISVRQEIINRYNKEKLTVHGNLEKILCIISALVYEKAIDKNTFIDDVNNISELNEKFEILWILLRRIELTTNENWTYEAYKYIEKHDISAFMIAELLYSDFSLFANRKKVMDMIGAYYRCTDNVERYIKFASVGIKYEGT